MNNMDRLFNKQMEDLKDQLWSIEGELLKAHRSGRSDLIEFYLSDHAKVAERLLEYELLK